jgi:hypothetical protein
MPNYLGWKDLSAVTINSVDLHAWTVSVAGLHYAAVIDDFKPAGTVWPTPLDTGQRTGDPIVIVFKADGAAGGPNVTCTMGLSSTWTLTLGSGISVTGTFIISDLEYTVADGGDNQLQVTGTPTGTITYDYTT